MPPQQAHQQTTLSLALVCPRQWQHHRRRGSSACGLVGPSRSLASTGVSLSRSREGNHRPPCQARRQVVWRKWLESGEKD